MIGADIQQRVDGTKGRTMEMHGVLSLMQKHIYLVKSKK